MPGEHAELVERLKKGCYLPSSSSLQLPSEEGIDPCARCKELNLVCVLDDYSKRTKIEYTKSQLEKASTKSPGSYVSSSSSQIVKPRSNRLKLELVRKVNLASTEGKKEIQARESGLTLDNNLTVQVARLADFEDMISYNRARVQFVELSSLGSEPTFIHKTCQEATHRLLSKLFQVVATSQDKMIINMQIGSNPVLYRIGYIYEAFTFVLQSQAPFSGLDIERKLQYWFGHHHGSYSIYPFSS